MPRTADWIHRVRDIQQQLSELPDELLDRSCMETLFGVSSRQASRILSRMGARNVGGALVISRKDLMEQLADIARNKNVVREQFRRARLSRTLAAWERELPARNVVLSPLPARSDGRFGTDVEIREGCLQVPFGSPVELLQKLLRLAQAAAEDWTGFEAQVRSSTENHS
jgi:hypothetical protein